MTEGYSNVGLPGQPRWCNWTRSAMGLHVPDFGEFLETTPPDKCSVVRKLVSLPSEGSYLRRPNLRLQCPSPTCDGIRSFQCESGTAPAPGATHVVLRPLAARMVRAPRIPYRRRGSTR